MASDGTPLSGVLAGLTSSAEAGVVVQLLGLQPPAVAGTRVASNLVGAFTSTGAAGTLLFTLPSAVRLSPCTSTLQCHAMQYPAPLDYIWSRASEHRGPAGRLVRPLGATGA